MSHTHTHAHTHSHALCILCSICSLALLLCSLLLWAVGASRRVRPITEQLSHTHTRARQHATPPPQHSMDVCVHTVSEQSAGRRGELPAFIDSLLPLLHPSFLCQNPSFLPPSSFPFHCLFPFLSSSSFTLLISVRGRRARDEGSRGRQREEDEGREREKRREVGRKQR